MNMRNGPGDFLLRAAPETPSVIELCKQVKEIDEAIAIIATQITAKQLANLRAGFETIKDQVNEFAKLVLNAKNKQMNEMINRINEFRKVIPEPNLETKLHLEQVAKRANQQSEKEPQKASTIPPEIWDKAKNGRRGDYDAIDAFFNINPELINTPNGESNTVLHVILQNMTVQKYNSTSLAIITNLIQAYAADPTLTNMLGKNALDASANNSDLSLGNLLIKEIKDAVDDAHMNADREKEMKYLQMRERILTWTSGRDAEINRPQPQSQPSVVVAKLATKNIFQKLGSAIAHKINGKSKVESTHIPRMT